MLYSCLNVKELLAPNRCNIWSLNDCNKTWTHNHLVCGNTQVCEYFTLNWIAFAEDKRKDNIFVTEDIFYGKIKLVSYI